MSILYTFEFFLNVKFSRESIKKIIYQGKDLGFTYADNWGENIILDPEKAIDKIFYIHEHKEDFDETSLEAKYQDTWMFFYFYETPEGLLQFNMGPSASMWKEIVDGEEGYYIDKERYINVMYKLLKDFEIMKFDFYADNDKETIIPTAYK